MSRRPRRSAEARRRRTGLSLPEPRRPREPARVETLANGVRLVCEPMPSAHSCSIGVWLEAGSRYESEEEAGLTHFFEHMLFKGTAQRTARQIADAINEVGGQVNAFTSQDQLCLHARTVEAKAPQALDLLAELLLESKFPADEIVRERQVVLEECKLADDTPDELSVDVFVRNLWPGHALGRPIIGRPGTIRQFTRPRLETFHAQEVMPARLVVTVAGAFDADALTERIDGRFGRLNGGRAARLRNGSRPSAAIAPRQSSLRRPVEQTHFCLGTLAPSRTSADRFAFSLMNHVLGGGMSSRLFQEIREKRGLAYSIGSFMHYFQDTGFFAVSGGTSPATLGELLRIALDEIDRICDEKVPEAELESCRAQWIDGLLMGMDSTENRMMRLADSLLTHGRIVGLEEILNWIRQVTAADVQRVARRYLRRRAMAMGAVGPARVQFPARLRRWPATG